MNTKTFFKRLANAGLLTKAGRIKDAYSADLSRLKYCKEATNMLHLKTWSRYKGKMRLNERPHERTLELLGVLKLKYELGNDAAKGGATGDYIRIRKSEISKIPFDLL